MIDLAEMKGIEVDPDARTARAEGGVLWGELNDAAAKHGLAVTGGAFSTTGVAGLTLGGGLGWLMARYGLAADNLVSVELVMADGSITEVTEASDADLFGRCAGWRELRDRHGADVTAPASGWSPAG
jgi:FAD/FMN-containing dehydrogenase